MDARRVFVSGFPNDYTEEDVHAFLEKEGVTAVSVVLIHPPAEVGVGPCAAIAVAPAHVRSVLRMLKHACVDGEAQRVLHAAAACDAVDEVDAPPQSAAMVARERPPILEDDAPVRMEARPIWDDVRLRSSDVPLPILKDTTPILRDKRPILSDDSILGGPAPARKRRYDELR